MVSVDLSSLHGILGSYVTHWKLDLTDAASTPGHHLLRGRCPRQP
jgi:hypothetical protein